MCISSNEYSKKNYKIDLKALADLELIYNKSAEEETKEKQLAFTAELWLESHGILVKTDYGYYRNTFDILKDFGEYLVKNDKIAINLLEAADESRLA